MDETKKILIIDDDEAYVESIKVILEINYDVIVALNAEEGYQKLEEKTPDLLILDVMMDRKAAGFIFSRRMRKDHKFSNIPILMLTSMRKQTGFFFPGEAKDPVFLPVDEFVEKPIAPQDLLNKVDELLKKKIG